MTATLPLDRDELEILAAILADAELSHAERRDEAGRKGLLSAVRHHAKCINQAKKLGERIEAAIRHPSERQRYERVLRERELQVRRVRRWLGASIKRWGPGVKVQAADVIAVLNGSRGQFNGVKA